MMKRFFCLVMAVLFLAVTGKASAGESVESPHACKQCGMDRVAYAYSRMIVVYGDGSLAATCSLNCAVVEMRENKGKPVKGLRVADYPTKKLIDAKAATWVIGGNKPGTMTQIPKWAFARKEDARNFVKASGGRVTNFDEALNLALRENE